MAIITEAVKTPEIRAAEIISHLFVSKKRFIYKYLRSAKGQKYCFAFFEPHE